MAVALVAADRDYPQMIAETDHVEPAPRRVRATFGGEQIFDTTRPHRSDKRNQLRQT
jgi:hypothetical protein